MFFFYLKDGRILAEAMDVLFCVFYDLEKENVAKMITGLQNWKDPGEHDKHNELPEAYPSSIPKCLIEEYKRSTK